MTLCLLLYLILAIINLRHFWLQFLQTSSGFAETAEATLIIGWNVNETGPEQASLNLTNEEDSFTNQSWLINTNQW